MFNTVTLKDGSCIDVNSRISVCKFMSDNTNGLYGGKTDNGDDVNIYYGKGILLEVFLDNGSISKYDFDDGGNLLNIKK